MSQQIINISTPDDGLGDVLRNSFDKTNQNFTELYNGKVDKVTGKGLSENDFTDADKAKLDGIESGAQVNVQADLLQDDDLADDFVKNKDAVLPGRTPPQIQLYAGVSTFTIPVGSIVSSVLLVRTVLWDIDEWTQTDNEITITKTMNTGNRIQFNFY